MSDIALVRRVLAGEESAFDALFDGWFPPLYRFALARLGGNEDACEEVVQRTLIRALARLQTYRGEAALLTWLCTLCRHEIAAWREQAGRTREVPLPEEPGGLQRALDALAAAGDDPEAALRRREIATLVRLTLDYLPGRYGDVLEWRYIEGRSVDEIAGRLGVGYKAAESMLSRARAAFREGFAFVAGEQATDAAGS